MTTRVSSKLSLEEMQWDRRQPTEINYLKPNSFRFLIQSLPGVTYFGQSINIPEITLGVAIQPTPLQDAPYPGEKNTFGDLTVKFMIQDDLANYNELYHWIVGLGFPYSREQYIEYNQSQAFRFPSTWQNTASTNFSDATLIILNANNLPVAKYNFYDCFPISLTGFNLDISSGNVDYVQGTVVFKYLRYEPDTSI
jgi:hypothetical protein